MCRNEIFNCCSTKEGKDCTESIFSDFKKFHENNINYIHKTGGSYISLSDAFFHWCVLQKKISNNSDPANNNNFIDNYNEDEEENEEGYNFKLSNLLITPVHEATIAPAQEATIKLITNEHGMEPHVFSINNIDHMDYLMNIIKIIFLNCRCLYYNLIIYCAKTNDLHCGILLKSLVSQISN